MRWRTLPGGTPLSTQYTLPRGPRRQDQFDVEITALSPKGLGIANIAIILGPQREERLYRCLVPRAIPGDRCQIVVQERKRRTLTCRVLQFLSSDPPRSSHRCRHSGLRENVEAGCGGCSWQDIHYTHQLALKEKRIME